MPWMVPRRILRSMSRLAHTGPKSLLMPLSSMAHGEAESAGRETAELETAAPEDRCFWFEGSMVLTRPECRSDRARIVRHVVVHLDGAARDRLGGAVDRRLRIRADERLVVVVHRERNTGVLDAKDFGSGLEVRIVLERVVDGNVDALHHR